MTDEVDARFEDFLESEVQKYARMLRIYKRLDKVVSIVLAAASISSLLPTSDTMGCVLTGVGAASSPFGSLVCLSVMTILILSLMAKWIAKKKNKLRGQILSVSAPWGKMMPLSST